MNINICSIFIEKITRSGIAGLKDMYTLILIDTERVHQLSWNTLFYLSLVAPIQEYCSNGLLV